MPDPHSGQPLSPSVGQRDAHSAAAAPDSHKRPHPPDEAEQTIDLDLTQQLVQEDTSRIIEILQALHDHELESNPVQAQAADHPDLQSNDQKTEETVEETAAKAHAGQGTTSKQNPRDQAAENLARDSPDPPAGLQSSDLTGDSGMPLPPSSTHPTASLQAETTSAPDPFNSRTPEKISEDGTAPRAHHSETANSHSADAESPRSQLPAALSPTAVPNHSGSMDGLKQQDVGSDRDVDQADVEAVAAVMAASGWDLHLEELGDLEEEQDDHGFLKQQESQSATDNDSERQPPLQNQSHYEPLARLDSGAETGAEKESDSGPDSGLGSRPHPERVVGLPENQPMRPMKDRSHSPVQNPANNSVSVSSSGDVQHMIRQYPNDEIPDPSQSTREHTMSEVQDETPDEGDRSTERVEEEASHAALLALLSAATAGPSSPQRTPADQTQASTESDHTASIPAAHVPLPPPAAAPYSAPSSHPFPPFAHTSGSSGEPKRRPRGRPPKVPPLESPQFIHTPEGQLIGKSTFTAAGLNFESQSPIPASLVVQASSGGAGSGSGSGPGGSAGALGGSGAAGAFGGPPGSPSSGMGAALDDWSQAEPERTASGDVICPFPGCGKFFAKNRAYNLKAHLRCHGPFRPYKCLRCEMAFTRKHDLERHARKHVRFLLPNSYPFSLIAALSYSFLYFPLSSQTLVSFSTVFLV